MDSARCTMDSAGCGKEHCRWTLLLLLLLLPLILLHENAGIMPLKFCIAQAFPAADALRSAGYTVIADHLLQRMSSSSFSTSLPQQFTLFAPTDTAFAFLENALIRADDLLRYHVATRTLIYANLTSLPLGARIDTLLPHHSIVVTSLEGEILRAGHISLDGVQVIEPDLFVDEEIAVHGIAEVMNPYVFGQLENMPPEATPLADLIHFFPVFVELDPEAAAGAVD